MLAIIKGHVKGHIKGVSSERTFFARPLIKAQIKGHIGGPNRAYIGSDDVHVGVLARLSPASLGNGPESELSSHMHVCNSSSLGVHS